MMTYKRRTTPAQEVVETNQPPKKGVEMGVARVGFLGTFDNFRMLKTKHRLHCFLVYFIIYGIYSSFGECSAQGANSRTLQRIPEANAL